MKKVEPSGVVMKGVYSIQTSRCTATQEGPITAVWGPPGQTQINVCRMCLEEKIRLGEWEVRRHAFRLIGTALEDQPPGCPGQTAEFCKQPQIISWRVLRLSNR